MTSWADDDVNERHQHSVKSMVAGFRALYYDQLQNEQPVLHCQRGIIC